MFAPFLVVPGTNPAQNPASEVLPPPAWLGILAHLGRGSCLPGEGLGGQLSGQLSAQTGLFAIIDFIRVGLVNKIRAVSSVQFCTTASASCIVCSPPGYLTFTLELRILSRNFPEGKTGSLTCALCLLL